MKGQRHIASRIVLQKGEPKFGSPGRGLLRPGKKECEKKKGKK
jgi:hypothetical protein